MQAIARLENLKIQKETQRAEIPRSKFRCKLCHEPRNERIGISYHNNIINTDKKD
ncbi:hypothetical protein LguiA_011241 [Lonicera macranthoides]